MKVIFVMLCVLQLGLITSVFLGAGTSPVFIVAFYVFIYVGIRYPESIEPESDEVRSARIKEYIAALEAMDDEDVEE